jgi:hypothetical protein
MIPNERTRYGAGPSLIGCLFIASVALGTTAAISEDSAPLVEVMTVPGPPARLSKGYFANNPGCVSAKLDIWFARGRHSHQVFTMHAEQAPGPPQSPGETTPRSRAATDSDKTNPAFNDVMDADGTTIFVGADGCRFRVRIDKAE